jgi:hypothetical protein
MKKHVRVYMVLLAVLLIVAMCSLMVFADVGNHNSYSKSSSSHSSSSGSSHSANSSSGLIWLFLSMPWPIKIIIVLGVIAFCIWAKKNKGKTVTAGGNVPGEARYSNTTIQLADRSNEIEAEIKKTDQLFSTPKFLGWVEEVFMTIQQAWMDRDWAKIRPFEKEELFKKHELQLEEYKRLGQINMMERININKTYMHKYERDTEFEYLTVLLSARMNDYVIDEKTKQVVKGNPNDEFFTDYVLVFMRKFGVKTDPATSNVSTKSCPHCGAPVQITSAGKCEYCDFIVTTGEHDWVLCDLDSITDNSSIGNGGVEINS